MMLKDKTAIVTGSAQGIGKAIALALAQQGTNVVVSDVNLEEAQQTANEIAALGTKSLAIKCNVADASEVDALVKQAQSAFPTIDILVNNAGVTRDNLMMRMDEKDWDLVLDVNLKGAFLMTKAVTRIMMKQRSGRIISVSSIVALSGNAGQANYSASKAGIIGLTKSLARELAPRNICVNAVAPGLIITDMTSAMTEEQREKALEAIPLSRLGTPDDVAGVVLFLASDETGYITGQVIGVNGGLYM
jgi:3-oxoacyl-[acyl-carrier protein] reductase